MDAVLEKQPDAIIINIIYLFVLCIHPSVFHGCRTDYPALSWIIGHVFRNKNARAFIEVTQRAEIGLFLPLPQLIVL